MDLNKEYEKLYIYAVKAKNLELAFAILRVLEKRDNMNEHYPLFAGGEEAVC